jgi:hypothetical protein
MVRAGFGRAGEARPSLALPGLFAGAAAPQAARTNATVTRPVRRAGVVAIDRVERIVVSPSVVG